jgi:hypothetical protein
MIDILRESLSAESDYRLEIVQVARQSAPIGRAGVGGSLNFQLGPADNNHAIPRGGTLPVCLSGGDAEDTLSYGAQGPSSGVTGYPNGDCAVVLLSTSPRSAYRKPSLVNRRRRDATKLRQPPIISPMRDIENREITACSRRLCAHPPEAVHRER